MLNFPSLLELAGKLRATLRNLGAHLPGDKASHFDSPTVAARFLGQDAVRLVRALKDHRVLISARHGNLRISTHLYHSEEDFDRLECVLRTLL